jgi:hypothetical protein
MLIYHGKTNTTKRNIEALLDAGERGWSRSKRRENLVYVLIPLPESRTEL